ncbi:excinuclease ABC subunit C, partial [Candidatus Micrarchaeota archaeon]|nr:excinuclease ABC subunit C [Candidatus Micrarchaeota archaeon]
ALEYRRQIDSVKLDSQRQVVDTQAGFDEDVIGVASKHALFCANVFSLKQGVVQARDYYKIEALDEENFLPNFLLQYYQTHYPPSKIIVAKEFAGIIELSEILSKKYSKQVLVKQAKARREKELIELAEKNSLVSLGLSGSTQEVLELQKNLGLSNAPKVMECFDISHLGGTNTVASMVRFVDGKPEKSSYRKYNIKTVKGIDDFASMSEVVYRRYSRLKAEGKQFPDLVVIDGGAGQLSAAIKALEKAGVDLPVIALAKKLEEVYQPDRNEAMLLPKNSRSLRLLQAIRDEAHRFAITFQRKKRKNIFREEENKIAVT